MTKGDKVQSKYKFKLINAVVDRVFANRTVQVYHDVWQRKWIGKRPQLGQSAELKRVRCRCLDMFDIDHLVVIDG